MSACSIKADVYMKVVEVGAEEEMSRLEKNINHHTVPNNMVASLPLDASSCSQSPRAPPPHIPDTPILCGPPLKSEKHPLALLNIHRTRPNSVTSAACAVPIVLMLGTELFTPGHGRARSTSSAC